MRRWAELLSVTQYDLVFLYREAIPLGPPILESLIARSGVPIVYDFDDAIFLQNVSEANRAISFLKDPGRVATILKRSTQVVVGNEFLAAYARQHNPAVNVIPTAVDTTRFVPQANRCRRGRPAVSSSAGSAARRRFRTWRRSRRPPRGVGDASVHAEGQRRRPSGAFSRRDVEEVQWSLGDEVSLFNTCDIGVYPLTDDEWSKGKCGFKAIQCMACGVPVVAAAVGVNREIISTA